MLKNDTLKNGTFRIGLYGSAPRGSEWVLSSVHTLFAKETTFIFNKCAEYKDFIPAFEIYKQKVQISHLISLPPQAITRAFERLKG